MRSGRITAVALAVAASSVAGDAWAVVQPTHFVAGLELADGRQARQTRVTTTHVPARAQHAWRALRHELGGSWVASWDEATHVPLRIWGTGVEAPGSVSSGKVAALIATEMLTRHVALLAPGASATDFTLVSNELHAGQRVVAFVQRSGSLRVLGGQLSFRFRKDRLYVIASQALPNVHADMPAVTISNEQARVAAQGWLAADFGAVKVESVDGIVVLPVVARGNVLGYRIVHEVTVSTLSPIGRFDVYIDSVSGEAVAREQTLRFATGSLMYNAPQRYPLAERADYPARFANATVDGSAATADEAGLLTFADPGPASVDPSLTSQYAQVFNQAGAEATTLLTLDADSTVVWDGSDDPKVDAQLNAFIHTQLIKDYVRNIAPEMNWVNGQMTVRVNHDDMCNAFYDGSSINFFRQSNPCENTGRLADVVYHEFGHGVHHHAVILGSGDFESALSEGVSDFLAATFNNDPAMGRGFFYSSQPLRHINPGIDATWPDDIESDPHGTGLIIAGALWDLRDLLIDKYGETEGVSKTNNLYYQAIKNASDIPSMYTEVLAADDDDGNLENGTPNVCEIVDAFSRHGLRALSVVASKLEVEPPDQNGHEITIEVEGLFEQCPNDTVNGATVIWHTERKPDDIDWIEMQGGPSLFSATIPSQLAGEVVRYRVEADLSVATKMSFPQNLADPMYQFFIGPVTPIYCTDFETDPQLDGWTHGLLQGSSDEGADDWQWDTPNGGEFNGDPSEAFSGTHVFGNDLGHGNFNGLYQSDKVNYADSPVIDVSGHDNVRLQYRRWLNVEDGFFDRGSIFMNGDVAWTNFASPNDDGKVHHTDREWRFHDVDATDFVATDGTLQVRFEIESDGGLEMGGWTLDDFCVVAFEGELPKDPQCGDGVLDAGEQCDDGNVLFGDGCDANCKTETVEESDTPPQPVVMDGGCGCRTIGSSSGNDTDDREAPFALLGLALAAVATRRRTPSC